MSARDAAIAFVVLAEKFQQDITHLVERLEPANGDGAEIPRHDGLVAGAIALNKIQSEIVSLPTELQGEAFWIKVFAHELLQESAACPAGGSSKWRHKNEAYTIMLDCLRKLTDIWLKANNQTTGVARCSPS